MSGKKYIELDKFLSIFQKFISESTWTKTKHKQLEKLINFLKKYETTTIRVGMEKCNHCVSRRKESDDWKNHTFISNVITIFRVPSNKMGKLYHYRNKWVLIRGVSEPGYEGGGWNVYKNEVYQLQDNFDETLIPKLKERLGKYFVVQPTSSD